MTNLRTEISQEGPKESLGFNAAIEGAACGAAKMQLQRPWEGLQKDFAP